MKKGNSSLIPRSRGRPRFSKQIPGVPKTPSHGLPRGGMIKNMFANLKRSRKGL